MKPLQPIWIFNFSISPYRFYISTFDLVLSVTVSGDFIDVFPVVFEAEMLEEGANSPLFAAEVKFQSDIG